MSLMSYQIPNEISMRLQHRKFGGGAVLGYKSKSRFRKTVTCYDRGKKKNKMHFYGAASVLLNISLKYQSLSPCATQALIEDLKIRHTHTHKDRRL